MSSILTTASTSMGMVILDPRSRSRSRHSGLTQVVCEPRKKILEMSKEKNEISGAPFFFFRGRWEIANRNSRNLHVAPKIFILNISGAVAKKIRVQNPCYDERLAERRPNPPNPYNRVPFHTPIPEYLGVRTQTWRSKQPRASTRTRDETQSET